MANQHATSVTLGGGCYWCLEAFYQRVNGVRKVTSGYSGGHVVTQLEKFDKFWPADADMQNYYNNNPTSGYCLAIIDPKIVKLRQKFASKLKTT